MQELTAERSVQVHDEVREVLVAINFPTGKVMRLDDLWCVDGIQHEPMDSSLAQILRNLRPGVVCAECLLVDVLFKDVSENVGIDLVVCFAGGIIQIPGVPPKESEQVFKCLVGHIELGIVFFDLMRQE